MSPDGVFLHDHCQECVNSWIITPLTSSTNSASDRSFVKFVRFPALKIRLLRHLNCVLLPAEIITEEFSACALPAISRMIRKTGPSRTLGVNVYVASEG